MTPLTHTEISTALKNLPGWQLERGAIVQTFEFADFVAAMAFVNRVAVAAEAAGHHPDIDIRWNHVRLALSSHDAGGITSKDIDLADSILHLTHL